MSEHIVGIDLGTTNSEIAAFIDGQVRVLGPGETRTLPSCVGFSSSGELLVGQAARNQQVLYPERTVRSIKRKMGSEEPVRVADKTFMPQEISALILRELVDWAERALAVRPSRAVITVPAYFSDAQRNATREAGALAGLEVVRILNEPTAASLAYGYGDGARHTALIYDLGGGTFDASLVVIEGDVTEVLSSHGNNRLGGDDFDDLLVAHLAKTFQTAHGVDPRANLAARARLSWIAEEAKKKLSFEPYVKVREEALMTSGGTPLHLDVEVSREDYEDLIRPLVESTLDSTSRVLQDGGKTSQDLDAIVLVGGSTRTPLVSRLLTERTGLEVRQEVHPDLCVALGAGVLASRLSGRVVDRVLVDVSPYSFGISFLDERGGVPYPHCYKPIIQRNTPLPVTRTERYFTSHAYQTEVDIHVYQGEDEDALRNVLVGDFRVEGLNAVRDANEVLCRMRLDLDGVLEVTAVEKQTGRSKQITIANAHRAKTVAEIAAGKRRIQQLFASRGELPDEWDTLDEDDARGEAGQDEHEPLGNDGMDNGRAEALAGDPTPTGDRENGPLAAHLTTTARQLLDRSRRLLNDMHPDDREEAIGLHETIEMAMVGGNQSSMIAAVRSLEELLFFIEGQR
jgi:molecular chaperone DnaK (HSP70)